MLYILWSKSDLCIKDSCKVKTKTIEKLLRIFCSFEHLQLGFHCVHWKWREEFNFGWIERLFKCMKHSKIRKCRKKPCTFCLLLCFFLFLFFGGLKKFIVTICAILFVRCTYFRCKMKKIRPMTILAVYMKMCVFYCIGRH